MYNGGSADIIASGSVVIDNSKYLTSKNPLTGLYYRLHVLNVGVSDLKKYRCEGFVNRKFQTFYIHLDLLGRCNYTFVIFMVGNFAFLVSSKI